MNGEARKLGKAAGHEPVALAGVLRTLLYAVLGTRLDARTLAELVCIAETVTALLVRHVVSPTSRRARRPRKPVAAQDAAGLRAA